MDLVKNRTPHAQLRDEETALVENAIRIAIDSIVNVLCGVNSARAHEHRRVVADRDKEIQRLESRLGRMEQEVQLLRSHGCTCSMVAAAAAHCPDTRRTPLPRAGERPRGEHSGCEAADIEAEVTSAQRGCDMSISLGLFARPPSHLSSQSHESASPSSPSGLCLDQAPYSSEASVLSDLAGNLTSPNLVVKEEPCDTGSVLIKWEMTEERFNEHLESTRSPSQEEDYITVKNEHIDRERERFMAEQQVDPDRLQVTDGGNPRVKKKGVPMSELPEEAQRLKRAAWRAASRRYYARKIARQQANLSRPEALPHIAASPRSQLPLSFGDKRRTLVSHLPDDSQVLQREAWRAASRRYYARKLARHQTGPAQYGYMLQDSDPSGGVPHAEQAGSHGNSEGIMCS